MNDIFRVAVVKSHQYLFECLSCKRFIEILLLHNSVEQLTTLAQLCYQMDIYIVFEVFIKLNYVGMVLQLLGIEMKLTSVWRILTSV